MSEYEQDELDFPNDSRQKKLALKYEGEFFIEKNNIVHDMISVKRVKLPKNGENWVFYFNKKPLLTLNGIKFTEKERVILRTPKGILELLSAYKDGVRSISKFKERIKCIK